MQFSPDNGRFDVRALAAGNYVIKAFSSLGPNQPVRAEARFTLTADLHNLHLALAPAPSIPIVVQMETVAQRPKNAAISEALRTRDLPYPFALPASGPGTNEAYASFDTPDNPRTLSLRNVEAGRYTAIIDARENPGTSLRPNTARPTCSPTNWCSTAGAPPQAIEHRADGMTARRSREP